jgi:copper ion binding protein
MKEETVKISGMSCAHCVTAVKKALEELDGVKGAEVEIGSAKVSFDESRVTRADMEQAIVKSGYKVAE